METETKKDVHHNNSSLPSPISIGINIEEGRCQQTRPNQLDLHLLTIKLDIVILLKCSHCITPSNKDHFCRTLDMMSRENEKKKVSRQINLKSAIPFTLLL